MKLKIRDLRLEAGLTMRQLADLVGTTAPQINKLEKGYRQLDHRWAARLAPYLGVRPEELLFPATQTYKQKGAKGAKALQEDAPVYGSTGARDGKYVLKDTFIIEKRPKNITSMGPKGFYIMVVGDSMEPLFEEGSLLAVNPDLPLVKGKPCVIQTVNNQTVVKKFISRNAREVVVEQLSPKRTTTYSVKEIVKIHRIVGQEF